MIPNKSLIVLGTLLVGATALIVACSDDQPTTPGGASSSGSSGTSSGSSGTSSGSTGGTSSGSTGGTSGNASSSSGDAGNDSGGTEGGALGATCTQKVDTGSTECASGTCAEYGGGGTNPKTLKCSIKCDGDNTKCVGAPPLNGQCNGKGYCNLSQ
jgi:hypothetical protein